MEASQEIRHPAKFSDHMSCDTLPYVFFRGGFTSRAGLKKLVSFLEKGGSFAGQSFKKVQSSKVKFVMKFEQ